MKTKVLKVVIAGLMVVATIASLGCWWFLYEPATPSILE